MHVGIRGDLEIKQPFWPLWIIWFAFFAYYAVSFFFLLVFFRLSLNTLPFSLFYTFDMSCMRCHVFILFIGIRDLIPGLIALAFYGVEGRMFCILFSAMNTLMELLMNPMCICFFDLTIFAIMKIDITYNIYHKDKYSGNHDWLIIFCRLFFFLKWNIMV